MGDELFCNVHGLQTVVGWWGPKQWPRARAAGRPRLIVCSELFRAIRLETSETISTHWGVHICTIANWRKKLGLESTLTAAGTAFRVAKMRLNRRIRPESYVVPGHRAIATLAMENRREIGRRTAGAKAWSPQELDLLRQCTNSRAALELHRSLSSIRNARHRHAIPHPATRYVCRTCNYEWLSYEEHPPIYCARRTCKIRQDLGRKIANK